MKSRCKYKKEPLISMGKTIPTQHEAHFLLQIPGFSSGLFSEIGTIGSVKNTS
jgi:hypothetical protein